MKQIHKNVSPFSNEARNTYVIEHINDAMMKLLKERPIGEISISAICYTAGVGRASFYRNYNSKEDIVKRKVDTMIKQWHKEYESSDNKDSNAFLYGSLFKHLKENSEFYLLLRDRKLIYLLLEVLLDISGPKKEDSNEWAYAKSFITYGTFGWIEEWISRGMKESSETMTRQLLSHGMK